MATNYQFGDVDSHCAKVRTAGSNMACIDHARGTGWA